MSSQTNTWNTNSLPFYESFDNSKIYTVNKQNHTTFSTKIPLTPSLMIFLLCLLT